MEVLKDTPVFPESGPGSDDLFGLSVDMKKNHATFSIDSKGNVTSWNKDAACIKGYTSEEIIGRPVSLFYTDEDIADGKPQRELQAALVEGCYEVEQRRVRKDGTTFWARVMIIPFIDDSGENTGFTVMMRDITNKKLYEDSALLRNEERLKLALTAAGLGVWELDVQSDEIFWSTECYEIYGVKNFGGRPQDFIKFLHPEDADRVLNNFYSSIADGSIFIEEFRIQRPDGQIRWVSNFGQTRFDESRKPLYVIGTVKDITEEKRAEGSLRDSEERFRALIDASAQMVWTASPDGEAIEDSPSCRAFTGQTYEEWRAFGWLDAVHPDDRAKAAEKWRQAHEIREPITDEFRLRHLSGEWRWMATRAVCLPNPDGSIRNWVGMNIDITEQKLAERRLATQNAISQVLAESESLIESTSEIIRTICEAEGWDFGAIWELDKLSRELRCINVWHKDKTEIDELEAKTREATFAPDVGLPGRVWTSGNSVFISDMAKENNCPRACFAMEAGLHSALGFPVLLGGKIIGVFEFLGSEIRQPDKKMLEMFDAIGHQIGQFIERKQVKDQVQRFVSFSPASLYALKIEEGNFHHKWTSDNILHLTGYRADEPIGMDWWASHIHPEDQQRIWDAHKQPYTTEHQILEYRFRRKDGTFFWVRDEKRLLRDAEGNPSEVIGAWSDITDRVELEGQLRQSQKMEAIGQLAGGVAHDFNNLLTVINGYSELLLDIMPEEDPGRKFVADIQRAGEIGASLTSQLLAFSRKQLLELKVLDVNGILSNIKKMVGRLIGENITLTTMLSPSITPVKVDPNQMSQVIINLAVNARDAMPYGGRLNIDTRAVELDEKYCRRRSEVKPGRYAMISVADTGCGMTADVKARIFEPFFTTKERGKGTGLGLATVFGIVKQSGGHIEVHSEPGIGTCFRIYLPVVEAEQPLQSSEVSKVVAAGGNETILLVEDEQSVRRIARMALDMHGYEVLEAGNGREGIAVYESYDGPIHLVVTDVVMPELGGRQLADHLQELYPDLKILFVSGYTDDELMRSSISDDRRAFLHKPFSSLALASKVREVLDQDS